MSEEHRICSTSARNRSTSVSSSFSSSESSNSSQQQKLAEALAGLVKRSSNMVRYSVDITMEMVDKLNKTIEGQREEPRRFAKHDRGDEEKVW